jgi:hypothetical protein
MAAFHIAPQGTFPKQLAKGMLLLHILHQLSVQLKRYALLYRYS